MTGRHVMHLSLAAMLTILVCGLLAVGRPQLPGSARPIATVAESAARPPEAPRIVDCVPSGLADWQIVTAMPDCPIRAAARFSRVMP